jgi:site-specific DNA-methyltransferase (adenine-specific)
MIPKLIIGQAIIYAGNNLDILPELQSNSVDSIVCDPPYELGFMGKSWDNSGIAYSVELWEQCLRVLKPGGHLLAFGGTRTWHRLAVAIEDAGFEIRDNIAWLYGSGFPKSHNISKAIDKMAGAERDEILSQNSTACKYFPNPCSGHNGTGKFSATVHSLPTAPAPDDAKAWEGWGTALKPAHEPIVVARKPLIGTVAENVLKYGTGGLNIDATRIGYASADDVAEYEFNNNGQNRSTKEEGASLEVHEGGWKVQKGEKTTPAGRWPANIILDEFTAELLDEQSGTSKSLAHNRPHDTKWGFGVGNDNAKEYDYETGQTGYSDSGGASRFFYVAKASKRDRNEGLENIEGKEISAKGNGLARTCNTCGASTLDGCDCPDRTFSNPVRQNFHPTVKPTALMQYLIRLVTPEGGVVLDPFAGSGSTGKAAILEGKRFIGIELTPEYLPIIEGRLKHAYQTLDSKEADLFE